MAARRLPANTWMSSLGVAIAVAAVKASGCTVGSVDMAPLEMLAASDECTVRADYIGARADEPPFHAIHEARNGEGGGVSDDGREGAYEDEEEGDEPAAREGAPFHGHGGESSEEGFGVDYEEDADCGKED
ncbi:hypothetical protein V490_09070, partial [Pseudogymnoascus sp. VKM F-3557]